MKLIKFILLALAAWNWSVGVAAGAGESSGIRELRSDRAEVVYAQLGKVTTIQFATDKVIETPLKGSEIISMAFNPRLRQLQVVPAGIGETNVNVTIDGIVYTLLVRCDQTNRVEYNPVFTVHGNGTETELESAMRGSRPLKPSEVDLNGYIRKAVRAQADVNYRQTLANYTVVPLARAYQWNECLVKLVEAHWFAEEDLILFRVEWVNRSNFALYLHRSQYELYAGPQKVRILASQQLAPRSLVQPGQLETVWLVVQGYKLPAIGQDWRLGLPPDAAAVQRLIQR